MVRCMSVLERVDVERTRDRSGLLHSREQGACLWQGLAPWGLNLGRERGARGGDLARSGLALLSPRLRMRLVVWVVGPRGFEPPTYWSQTESDGFAESLL